MECNPRYILERQDVFDTYFKRFVHERFPTLVLTPRKDGAALRYELRHGETLIVEVDTLPISDKLKVRVARHRVDDLGFCEAFLGKLGQDYGVGMSILEGVQLLVTQPYIEEKLADVRFDDPKQEALRRQLVDSVQQGLPPIEDAEPMPAEGGAGKRGRPALTEEEWQERFETVEAVLEKKKELYISEEKACARQGVPYSSFKDWKRKWKRRRMDEK